MTRQVTITSALEAASRMGALPLEQVSARIGRRGGHRVLLDLLQRPPPDDDGDSAWVDCAATVVALCTQAGGPFPAIQEDVQDALDRGIIVTFSGNCDDDSGGVWHPSQVQVTLSRRRGYHTISNMLWAASIVFANGYFRCYNRAYLSLFELVWYRDGANTCSLWLWCL